jgi:hypothetical protein
VKALLGWSNDVRTTRTSVVLELASSAFRAERHELADAIAPETSFLGDRGELVDFSAALAQRISSGSPVTNFEAGQMGVEREGWRRVYAWAPCRSTHAVTKGANALAGVRASRADLGVIPA